jgi:hypothetical protein
VQIYRVLLVGRKKTALKLNAENSKQKFMYGDPNPGQNYNTIIGKVGKSSIFGNSPNKSKFHPRRN